MAASIGAFLCYFKLLHDLRTKASHNNTKCSNQFNDTSEPTHIDNHDGTCESTQIEEAHDDTPPQGCVIFSGKVLRTSELRLPLYQAWHRIKFFPKRLNILSEAVLFRQASHTPLREYDCSQEDDEDTENDTEGDYEPNSPLMGDDSIPGYALPVRRSARAPGMQVNVYLLMSLAKSGECVQLEREDVTLPTPTTHMFGLESAETGTDKWRRLVGILDSCSRPLTGLDDIGLESLNVCKWMERREKTVELRTMTSKGPLFCSHVTALHNDFWIRKHASGTYSALNVTEMGVSGHLLVAGFAGVWRTLFHK